MVHRELSSCLAWMIACALALAPLRAHAQPGPGPTPPAAGAPSPDPEPTASDGARPWAAGISADEQAAAFELYAAGNHEFTESRFAQALAKYREAIQHWDHPAIRFNIAVCLINLDSPVEARDNLERSLVHGAAALGTDAYTQALTYHKLLDAQLAHVKIVCREPGAEVTLDGKLLFTGPGEADQYLRPGEHQMVASKSGFITASKTVVLVAGKLTTHDIEPMAELAPATRMVRRWDVWKPWAVIAGGVETAGLGALGYVLVAHDLAVYDRGIRAQCPDGCNAASYALLSDLRHRKSRADLEQLIASSLVAMGGAGIIAGLIGLVMNQPRMQLAPPRPLPTVTAIPGGAIASMTWRL